MPTGPVAVVGGARSRSQGMTELGRLPKQVHVAQRFPREVSALRCRRVLRETTLPSLSSFRFEVQDKPAPALKPLLVSHSAGSCSGSLRECQKRALHTQKWSLRVQPSERHSSAVPLSTGGLPLPGLPPRAATHLLKDGTSQASAVTVLSWMVGS